MKSFFGGTASTREACALRKPVHLESPSAESSRATAAPTQQREAASRAATPPGGGTAAQRSHATASGQAIPKRRSDYSDLDADDDQPATSTKGAATVSWVPGKKVNSAGV